MEINNNIIQEKRTNILLLVIKKFNNLEKIHNHDFIYNKFPYDTKILDIRVNKNEKEKFMAFIKFDNDLLACKAINIVSGNTDIYGNWNLYYCNNTKIINEMNSNILTETSSDLDLSIIKNNDNKFYKLNKLLTHNYPLENTLITKIKDFVNNYITINSIKLNIVQINKLITNNIEITINNYQKTKIQNFNLSNINRVILLENVNTKITITNIVNLFTCFGNIKTIVRNTNYFLIEYVSKKGTINSLNLHDKLLYKNKLIINLTSLKNLNIEFWKLKIFFDKNYELITNIQNRYTLTNNIKINQINNVLHFSNIPNEYNEIKIYKLLKFNKNITKIKKINANNNNIMFNIKFKNFNSAINVLSKYHNYKINNNKVKISFSFAKFD